MNGGETKPSDLVSLCSFHHRKVHEGGIEVQMLDDGAVRFVRLGGTAVDSSVPVPSGDWIQLPLEHQRDGLHIIAKTAATRGERCDYGLGVEVLMARHKRARAAELEASSGVSNGGLPIQGTPLMCR